jgi:uncharacterized membrane protein
MQKIKNWKTQTKIYFIIVGMVVLLNIIAWSSEAFCDWYIRYVFPVWVNTYGRLTGLFPFSVGEWLIVAGVFLVIAAVILMIASAFRWIIRRCRARHVDKQDKSSRAPHVTRPSVTRGRGRFDKLCCGFYTFFAWVLLAVLVLMTLNCTILYHATPFSEKYFAIEKATDDVNENTDTGNTAETKKGTYTLQDLTALRNMLVEKCNELSGQMQRTEEGEIIYEGNMRKKAISDMQALGETYDALQGFYPMPKPLYFSDFVSQQYMLGYYFPFSMEANYNKVAYVTNLPVTMCHELAHLKGYIQEDEANFIGFLACISSDDLLFQYSGYLSVLNYVNNDFYEAVGEDYERYMAEVQIDRQVYEDAVFVETSLKLNGVDDGMVAYSRVVDLLLQWYCQ